MRKCCDGKCWQGRDCPADVGQGYEDDGAIWIVAAGLIALFAVIVALASLAS